MKSKKRERGPSTQRYTVYKYIASTVIGQKTFEHFMYDKASSYLLINRKVEDITSKERETINMLSETYLYLDDVQ